MSLESHNKDINDNTEPITDTNLTNLAQDQIDSFFIDPNTDKPLGFFHQSSIITKPKSIWDLLNTLKACDENNKVVFYF